MVKVKVVNKDNTESTYDVTYPNAYVQAIIKQENLRSKFRNVKEIYVNDNIVARLISNDLVHLTGSTCIPNLPVKDISATKKRAVSVTIPSSTYWVTTSTVGHIVISYLAETTQEDDLPF
jgi:hypothetical protein